MLAQTLINAARMVARQTVRPHALYMNPRDHANMLDTFEYSEAEDVIRKRGGTYQAVTTMLGRMHVARRLAGRRHQRFHAMQWLVGK